MTAQNRTDLANSDMIKGCILDQKGCLFIVYSFKEVSFLSGI